MEPGLDITLLLYNGLTALDAVGPYEVLCRLPGARLTTVAPAGPSEVRTDRGGLAFRADGVLEEVERTDILVVPGGPASGALGRMPSVADALRRLHATSRITASVCTGSLILGAAGLLHGKRATTHWAFLDELRDHGATPVRERTVVDGKIYTAAGVSSGIDMALQLSADLYGEDVAKSLQLGIEYDPHPPFDAGSPETAPAQIVERLRAGFAKSAAAETAGSGD